MTYYILDIASLKTFYEEVFVKTHNRKRVQYNI